MKNYGISWVPVVSSLPDYGVLVGGGLFIKPMRRPSFDLGTYAVVSFTPAVKWHLDAVYLAAESWKHSIHVDISNFYSPYYGEGDRTTIDGKVNIPNTTVYTRLGSEYALLSALSLETSIDFRSRREIVDPTLGRYFPDESTAGIEVRLKYDAGRVSESSGIGYLHQLVFRAVPQGLSTNDAMTTFYQAEFDFRTYFSLSRGFVWATRVFGGYSMGEPTYPFRYTLGGMNQLRGYLDNRFRGKYAAVVQEEFRFPIWKIVSGTLFGDFGDVNDSSLRLAKLAYGGGLRIGLPPDFVTKVRLDFGFANDQSGIFFLFDEAF